jgi:hypothetical protein
VDPDRVGSAAFFPHLDRDRDAHAGHADLDRYQFQANEKVDTENYKTLVNDEKNKTL